MEGQDAAESPDNEYMAMDVDQWEDNNDGTYENGETLGIDTCRRGAPTGLGGGHNKDNKNRNNSNAAQPLPKRYMTIRRPASNQNKGAWRKTLFDLFRFTTVCMGLMCILLTASLIALSFAYDRLANLHTSVNERKDELIQENNKLRYQLSGIMQNMSMYQFSSTEYPCLNGSDLFVVNHPELQEHMTTDSFYLHYSDVYNGSWSNHYSWNCTC